MIQSHMLQMLAYVCMEPPASLRADALRNEKAKLLEAVRILKPDEIAAYTVRGQYGPGQKPSGRTAVGYRQEADVAPNSATETFAALKLCIDNWRWDGVPVYLRSGKSLWKRGTEIVVQFERRPEVIFRRDAGGPPGRFESAHLSRSARPGNRNPLSGQDPGPAMHLQKVNMRFDYREAFEASCGTGYEVLLYNCMIGDATLFLATDVVEASWRIVQPILDAWSAGGPPGSSRIRPARGARRRRSTSSSATAAAGWRSSTANVLGASAAVPRSGAVAFAEHGDGAAPGRMR